MTKTVCITISHLPRDDRDEVRLMPFRALRDELNDATGFKLIWVERSDRVRTYWVGLNSPARSKTFLEPQPMLPFEQNDWLKEQRSMILMTVGLPAVTSPDRYRTLQDHLIGPVVSWIHAHLALGRTVHSVRGFESSRYALDTTLCDHNTRKESENA